MPELLPNNVAGVTSFQHTFSPTWQPYLIYSSPNGDKLSIGATQLQRRQPDGQIDKQERETDRKVDRISGLFSFDSRPDYKFTGRISAFGPDVSPYSGQSSPSSFIVALKSNYI